MRPTSKAIAIGSRGDTQDRIADYMFAERGGVRREISSHFIRRGHQPVRRSRPALPGNHSRSADSLRRDRSHGLLGDLLPMPFQGFVTTDRKIRENPGQIKRWLKAAIRGLIFVRERPEESVDLGIKKLQLGNATRAMIVEGVKNYLRAISQPIPGLPSAEGIKNFLEYDIKIPLQIKEDIPPERLLSLQLVEG